MEFASDSQLLEPSNAQIPFSLQQLFLELLIQLLPQVFKLCKGQMKKRQLEERKEFIKINHQALQMKNATQKITEKAMLPGVCLISVLKL